MKGKVHHLCYKTKKAWRIFSVPKDYTVQVQNTVNADFLIDLLGCPQSVLCCDLLRCANPVYQESCGMSYRLQETGSSATPLARTVEQNRLSKYRCIF